LNKNIFEKKFTTLSSNDLKQISVKDEDWKYIGKKIFELNDIEVAKNKDIEPSNDFDINSNGFQYQLNTKNKAVDVLDIKDISNPLIVDSLMRPYDKFNLEQFEKVTGGFKVSFNDDTQEYFTINYETQSNSIPYVGVNVERNKSGKLFLNFDELVTGSTYPIIEILLNENANLEEIIITRKNNISDGGGRIKAKINLLSAIDLSDPSQNIRIFDGDTILISKSEDKIPSKVNKILRSNINPKFINVVIGGQIENQSNFFKIGRNSSLLEAIEISGGTKLFKGPVKFIRYNSDGTYEKRKFKLSKKASKGSYKNPYLREGDIIIVGKGSLKIASEIINEITSPFRGLVTTYGLYEALTD